MPAQKQNGVGILRLAVPVSSALANPAANPWVQEAPNLAGQGIFRIASNPLDANWLVAATTHGLFARFWDAGSNKWIWVAVASAPFTAQSSKRLMATDAVWVPAVTSNTPTVPARLFVAVVNMSLVQGAPPPVPRSGIYVRDAGSTTYTWLPLPHYAEGSRLALAAAIDPGTATEPPSQVIYVLGSAGANQPRLWRIDSEAGNIGPAAVREVEYLPPQLFGGICTGLPTTGDQSWYDMAVAVDPTNHRRIFLGGSTEYAKNQWNASLYRFTLQGSRSDAFINLDFDVIGCLKTPWLDAGFIGEGVHADVHCITLSPDGTQVWVGCDGGIFASSAGGARGSFKARNTGLAIAECGFIASHPRHPGSVAAGTQDNGVIRRIGDSIWLHYWPGDGGGVQFHPQSGSEAHLIGQYVRANWRGSGRFDKPIGRPMVSGADFNRENNQSMFYSGAAAAAGTGSAGRLAIGTYRVWLAENWSPAMPWSPTQWRTLPSNSDPLAAFPRDFMRDRVNHNEGTIISVKWLNPGIAALSGFKDSSLIVLYERAIARFDQDTFGYWHRKIVTGSKYPRATENAQILGNAAEAHLPAVGAWSEIAPHRKVQAGAPLGFTGSFYVATTGRSETGSGGSLIESNWMDTLWWFDGLGSFYPTGLRNHGTKAPALAVICDPQSPDTLYAGTALGVWKGTLMAGPVWTWKPFSIGLPEAVVQDLSIHWDPANPTLKLLRAALQARGVWEVDISAAPTSVGKSFLRVHPLDTRQILPSKLVNLTEEDAAATPYSPCLSPDINVVAAVPAHWHGNPTEADLFEHKRVVKSIAPSIRAEKVGAQTQSAFVLVHYRHTNAAPVGAFKVALLKRRLTEQEGDGRGVALSPTWKGQILSLLANGSSGVLDDGWSRAEASEAAVNVSNTINVANGVRHPLGPIDARTPSAALFTLRLTGATAGRRYLLLAVMSSVSDPLSLAGSTPTTVEALVLNNRHACARLIYV